MIGYKPVGVQDEEEGLEVLIPVGEGKFEGLLGGILMNGLNIKLDGIIQMEKHGPVPIFLQGGVF